MFYVAVTIMRNFKTIYSWITIFAFHVNLNCIPRVLCHSAVPQHCDTAVCHNTVPQDYTKQCETALRYNTVPQHCATRLRHSSAQRYCATALCYSTALQHCATALRHGTVPQHCASTMHQRTINIILTLVTLNNWLVLLWNTVRIHT